MGVRDHSIHGILRPRASQRPHQTALLERLEQEEEEAASPDTSAESRQVQMGLPVERDQAQRFISHHNRH